MSDPVSTSRSARESLARGLAALQTDPNVPPQIMDIAEPIAQAMGALHQIERSQGAEIAPHAENALGAVRGALAKLQAQPATIPAVANALEAVAASLGLVHQLSKMTAPAPAPAPAPVAAAGPAIPRPGTAPIAPALNIPRPGAPQAAPAPQPIQPQPVMQAAPAQPMQPQPVMQAAPAPQPMQPQPVMQAAPAPQPMQPQPVMQAAPAPQPMQPQPVMQAAPAQPMQPQPVMQAAPAQPIQPQAAQPGMAHAATQVAPIHLGTQPIAPIQAPAQPPMASTVAMQPAPQMQAPAHPPTAPSAFQPQGTGPMPAADPFAQPRPAAPMPAGDPFATRPATPVGAPAADPFAQPRPAAPAGNAQVINADLGAHSPTNFYKGLSGNDIVDHGGLFVATYMIPKIGTPVRLRVSLPGGYEFEAGATVRWAREQASDGAQPGFGAQFTDIAPEARQLIYRYVRNREPLFHDDL